MARDKEAGTGKGIRVDVRRRGDGVVISIIGELHVGASEELRSALATAVSERLRVIVLDLKIQRFIAVPQQRPEWESPSRTRDSVLHLPADRTRTSRSVRVGCVRARPKRGEGC